ncbi:DUF1090 domain-containing protein [Commensalibacter papalotli (ex Servin-Garciduenas et al. 2014)]|uniref:DUF1090 domain-containing protein n=1 Tax=Commensalibacter papalotli (ex Servin-Garciduenas et al. 2014) TaxID=1208583 RepID=W7DKR3_9PROT|nr:DUF1090 domain-containing protein [Commensalibacter papalotli (ex Servin-Garciduenas et al. 2014)]EUK17922.1 hypothetical protein COMX_08015 [Commensalibacter papalotli (ex Servin-Garciduenas et al. 2014)]
MLKSIIKISCLSTIFIATVPAFADDYYHFETCKEKVTEIEQKITYEKQQQKQYKVEQLEKKLSYIKTKCQDTELQKGYQLKVNHKQVKVTERTKELKQAQQDGKTTKIREKEAKLHEAQTELKAAQDALESFKKNVNSN